jgi:hypothetical protein
MPPRFNKYHIFGFIIFDIGFALAIIGGIAVNPALIGFAIGFTIAGAGCLAFAHLRKD